MLKFALRRLPQLVLTVLFITMLVFGLMQLAPGDPLDQLVLTNPNITPEEIEHMKARYGLDRPVYIQYLRWLGQTVQGNFGYSRLYHQPVTDILPGRIVNTLMLTGASLLLSLLVAIPIGIYSAVRQYSRMDHLLSILAFMGISIPTFWLGLLLILLFSVTLGWLPPGGHYSLGASSGLIDQLRYFVLPVIVLSLFSTASWMRYMRSSMLEVIYQDFMTTARSKGLRERTVILRHALKNALIPVVTLVAISIPGLLSGAIVTETIFSWPGMGRLIFDSLMNNDYPVSMATFLVFSTLVVLFNFIADLLYTLLDPRISYE